MSESIIAYKHGINVVSPEPTGDAGAMLNDDLKAIGDNFDSVLNNQSANKVYAGPASGGAASPTFRSLVAADVPTLNQNTSGSAASLSANLPTSKLNSGTNASSSTFWRGDAAWASAPQQIRITFDGGGSAIATGGKVWASCQWTGTITGYTLLADQSGSIVVSVKKCTYSGFPTTSSITGSNDPTLSSAQKATDSTLTSWTTSVSAGDIIEFSVTSASTVQHVQLFINIQGA